MRLIAVATSFQGLLSMLEKDKVEKGQDMYTPDLYDDNYAKCKTPSSISAADMYCYCSQRWHKFSFPYVKILVPASFFFKTRWSSKNLTRANQRNFYPDLFPVAPILWSTAGTPNSLIQMLFLYKTAFSYSITF